MHSVIRVVFPLIINTDTDEQTQQGTIPQEIMLCSAMKPSNISTNRRQPPHGKNVGPGNHSQVEVGTPSRRGYVVPMRMMVK